MLGLLTYSILLTYAVQVYPYMNSNQNLFHS
nr:MAG TPA: hypothetical protein [Caudoviricetes sp.]